MTGDQADVAARIKALLPNWFGQQQASTPILDALLQGPAWALALIYTLYAYAKLQTRISTATDGYLDLIAGDYFGGGLRRRGRTDTAYRTRILAMLLAPKVTHGAVVAMVELVTGNTPTITDPGKRAGGRGAYGAAMGYGTARGYAHGDLLNVAYQALIDITRGTEIDDNEIRSAVEAVRPAGVVFHLHIHN